MADKKTPDDKASTPGKKKAAAKKPAAKKTAAKKTPHTGAESPYRDDTVVPSETKGVVAPAAMTPSSGQPLEVPSGDLQRLLSLEHAGPHAFLGAHPLANGGIIIRALAPDVMRAVVVVDDGRTIEMARVASGL